MTHGMRPDDRRSPSRQVGAPGTSPLFVRVPLPRSMPVEREAGPSDDPGPDPQADSFRTEVTGRILDVYERAANLDDPFELRDLWLGRIESELGPDGHREQLVQRWRASRVRRSVGPEEVLGSRVTVRFVKELFNWFFRDDLYGELRDSAAVILSGGSVDEQAWGMPAALKDCIRFALDRDWYGYSDSRGRVPAREAVARYENARIETSPYDVENVALTMGGTFAVNSLSDFILHGGAGSGAPALCAIPNYPPLVEAVARRREVRLVPLPSDAGRISLAPLIAGLRPDTPLVMLQTVANPTGAAVDEAELSSMIEAAAPQTMIVLDECHEWLGPARRYSKLRAASNVVRVSSLSKNWSAPGVKMGWILASASFIADYYEYASTAFGGPPSFFYTLIEVLARMERWLITGVESVTPRHLAEFEETYQLTLPNLQAAYDSYRYERLARERGLIRYRDVASAGFAEAGSTVVRPRYSVNMALRFDRWADSYLCFRTLLRDTGVSVLPGILTFCFSQDVVRVTSARRWDDLDTAIRRVRSRLLPGIEHGTGPGH